MKKINLIVIIFLFINSALGQNNDSLVLSVNIKWNDLPFRINSNYISKNNDTLKISQLKFYLSDIQVLFEDKSVLENKKHHLINIENINSMKIPIGKRLSKIKAINFSIGVDSLSSVSGALSGDLDASNGMYWAWQSGYINIKIEGTSSSCKTRKNAFYFHIGGYLSPNYALRKVTLNPNSESLELEMNLEHFFDNLQLSEINSVMIPGTKAMELANYYSKIFTIK